MLTPVDGATTQRLQPRATAPAPILEPKPRSRRRRLLIAGAVALVLLGIILVVAIRWQRNSSQTQLIYPGASMVLDLRSPDGSRTVHLQTPDSLDKVESWYQSNLSLTKTTRLTANSYVLKNDEATITLVVENNTTNILIKQSP